jgi:hypothetical protein
MRNWARFKAPTVNVDREFEIFCDYWRGHGTKMADWVATWRNWMRRAPQFAKSKRGDYSDETPCYQREGRSLGPPLLIREHPLFKGIK